MESNRRAIDYFWIISRAILILMCFYPLLKVSKNASLFSNIVNGSSLIYVILMIIVCKDEVLKKKKKNQLKFYTGVLSFMYGIFMSLAIIQFGVRVFGYSFNTGEVQIFLFPFLLMIMLCVWMILFGVHDLRNRKIV
ncbi:MAG: L-asparagine transporter-like permease [Dokdonia sp.]|jgi:L-asparagine transporter-like permease